MPLLLVLLSAVCATVPMLVFLAAIWFLDRYEREPLWLFFLVFLWGAAGATAFSLFGNEVMTAGLVTVFGAEDGARLAVTFGAPLVEEPMKAAVLFAVMFSRHFDNATDGFVYGAASGLGFGMTENFLYFVGAAASGDPAGWFATVLARTFFSAVMHASATSTVGAMLGWARFAGLGAKIVALPVGFGIAVGMHALWNGLLTVGDMRQDTIFHVADFVLFPLEFLLLFTAFQFALWDERRAIRRELADEVEAGLLPLPHASAVASYLRRHRDGWLPPGVPRTQYVRAVTRLALRKHQCRNASARAYAFYEDEVTRLRLEVRALLALPTGPRAPAPLAPRAPKPRR